MTSPMNVATIGSPKHGSLGRRFAGHFEANPDKVAKLNPDSVAAREARSIFQHAVMDPQDAGRVLVTGAHQRKIGNRVTKGAWRGMAIYTLTLEERATCLRSCDHWLTCYGNAMPYSRRHRHGDDLEIILGAELRMLAIRQPKGFVVRLHILGDFYSPAYVAQWQAWFAAIPQLHVFGYTARHPDGDVGRAVLALNTSYPERCLIRFSGEAMPDNVLRARTIWRKPEAPRVPEGLPCPVQTGRVEACGDCALCWNPAVKSIVFVAHGAKLLGAPRKVVA